VAQNELDEVINLSVKQKQAAPVRRLPYRPFVRR